jgi:hypothetical protein
VSTTAYPSRFWPPVARILADRPIRTGLVLLLALAITALGALPAREAVATPDEPDLEICQSNPDDEGDEASHPPRKPQ